MKISRLFNTLVLAGCVVTLAGMTGCGTQHKAGQFQVVQGERFDYRKVSEIVDGTTSDNSLYDYFGQPVIREGHGAGEKLVWRFTEVKRDETTAFLKSDAEEVKVERTLVITVEDGIVKSHDYSERKTKTTESNRF